MKMRSPLVALAMGALVLAPIAPEAAQAATARAGNTNVITNSGSLLVFASGSQTFVNPKNSYNVSVNNGTYTFFINNGGDFDVSRFALIISLPANVNASLKRCDLNVTFTGANCTTGTSSSVTFTPGVAFTLLIPLPKNGFYSFQITQNKSGTMQVHTYANSSYITNRNYSS